MTVPVLDQRATGYALPQAYWLAKASALAYEDEDTIVAEANRWGFDRVEFFNARHEMPFPIEDTQAFVAASDHMIIVTFRGTEPVKIYDWLSDVNTPMVPGPAGTGLVHYGFSRALVCVFPEIIAAITRLRTRDQTLWLAGHSLGGALAMLASAALHFEDPELLATGVYTFGQPRTCDRALARAYNPVFAKRTYRFVNNNDIVAQVPPEPVFHHVEATRYFDARGRLHTAMPLLTGLTGLTDRLSGLTADAFAPGTDMIRDHMIARYIENIERTLS